jgi:hypothetical protein
MRVGWDSLVGDGKEHYILRQPVSSPANHSTIVEQSSPTELHERQNERFLIE